LKGSIKIECQEINQSIVLKHKECQPYEIHQEVTQTARLHSEDKAFALVTVLSAQAPTSGKAGDKAAVMADYQRNSGFLGVNRTAP